MLTIPAFPIAPYAPAYTAAVLVGFAIALSLGLRRGFPPVAWSLLIVAALTGGIIGSKLIDFDLGPLAAGEKTILGGLLLASFFTLAAARLLRFGPAALDALAPAALAGMAIGRVGCVLAGCCHGALTSLPWGVRYGVGTSAHFEHVQAGLISAGAISTMPVHPVQLYEAGFDVLLIALFARLTGLRAAGSRWLAVSAAYAAGRLGFEFLRADRPVVPGLTSVQWVLLAVFLCTILMLVCRERRARAMQAGARNRQRARALELARLNSANVPLEVRAFVAQEGVIAQQTDARVMACAAVLAAPVLAILLLGDWLTALEHAALVLVTGGVVAFTLISSLRSLPFSAPIGVSSLAVVMLAMPQAQDGGDGYPRSHFLLGGSYLRSVYAGAIGHTTEDNECVSCEGGTYPCPERVQYEGDREYAAAAGSIVYRNQLDEHTGMAARFSAFQGRDRRPPVAAGITPTNGGVEVSGYGGAVGIDGHYAGLLLGYTFGQLSDEGAERDEIPVWNARLGSLSGLFAEIGTGNADDLYAPWVRRRATLGYGFGTYGSFLKVGFGPRHRYLRSRLLVPSPGLEIDGLLGYADGVDSEHLLFGISVSKRFGGNN